MSKFVRGDRVNINNPDALEPTWRNGTGTILSVEEENTFDSTLGPLYRLWHDQHRREAGYFESTLTLIRGTPEGMEFDE